jgi:hypothetical protein
MDNFRGSKSTESSNHMALGKENVLSFYRPGYLGLRHWQFTSWVTTFVKCEWKEYRIDRRIKCVSCYLTARTAVAHG